MFRAFQRHLTAYLFDVGQSMGLVVLGIQFDKCKSRWLELFILQEEKITFCSHEFTRIRVSTYLFRVTSLGSKKCVFP